MATGAVEEFDAAGERREEAVERAVRVLEEGGLLAHPTSTVYGIGGRADAATDGAIRRLKGREGEGPLIRLAADVDQLLRVRPAVRWTEAAADLAERFWPGGLTLVLDDGSEEGIGVRVDGHPLARAVPRRWGELLSSTSLNRTGEEPARAPGPARRLLRSWAPPAARPIGFLNAGRLAPSRASTVLSLRGGRPRVLREGAVGADELAPWMEPGGSR